jgi:DNA-directed RNA polymerase subunit RPC12/RpoP
MRAAVEEKEIVCNHCGGVRLVRDPEIDHVKVQEKDPETGDPVGPWHDYDAYVCMDCGKPVYVLRQVLVN